MESNMTSCTVPTTIPVRKRQVTNEVDPNVPIGYKRCAHCGEIKPLSEFNKDKTRKDGHNSWCRCCTKEAQKKWDAARRDKKKADTKQKPVDVVPGTGSEECTDSVERPKLPFNYQRKVNRMQALAFAPETKECSSCHKVKPMTEFSCNKSHLDGFENKCKQCMSEERKLKREQKRQEEENMKQQKANAKNNVQTFEYLAIGTKLYYIHDDIALEAPIKNVNIDITSNGALISYVVPTEKPTEDHKIFANEVGSTVFTNPLELVTYFFKKQGMKYNIIK